MTKHNHALSDLIHSETSAREFGFDWPNQEMALAQATSECEEIRLAMANHEPPERLQEEIGDLLHAAVSLCLFMGFDVEETVAKANDKFIKRMNAVKLLTKQAGLSDLNGQSIDFMLSLWAKAKEQG